MIAVHQLLVGEGVQRAEDHDGGMRVAQHRQAVAGQVIPVLRAHDAVLEEPPQDVDERLHVPHHAALPALIGGQPLEVLLPGE